MPGLCLQELASACDAVLHGANAPVTSVGIDSRTVRAGQLFVALRGERVDGHQFVGAARAAGAAGAVVETLQTIDLPQLLVANAATALAEMASFNRSLYTGTVIAITGSAGKTTCKNMLAAILAEAGTVHATRGNLNNELGVPLTLLELDSSQQYAIVEMGAAKAGDIAYLTDLARPQVGLVTNISEAHLGGFGSLQITAKTKGELYAALPDGGIAVLNRDEPFSSSWEAALRSGARDLDISTYSLISGCGADSDSSADKDGNADKHSSANIVASEIDSGPRGQSFTATGPGTGTGNAQRSGWQLKVCLQLLGQHNISNALGSIAIAKALQVDDAAIKNGLAKLVAAAGRLQPRDGKNALSLIDDSYNANPAAMRAAIDTLAGWTGDKALALGDMAELGADAAQLHRDVGAYAARCGIDYLFACGAHAEDYVDGFNAAAEPERNSREPVCATCFADYQQLAAHLLKPVFHAATVLVKGSRSAAMERLVALLASGQPSESPGLC